jgi:nucleoside-diphosphate-sugar epimerase
VLDATRARELFGFEAKTPLREGLERTIAWYRANAPAHAAS